MEQKNIKLPQNSLLIIIVISLLVGGFSGAAAGFTAAGLLPQAFNQWLINPLGLGDNHSQNAIENGNVGRLNTLEEESATTGAVKKVTPAVVSIIVSKELQQYNNSTGFDFPFGDLFGLPLDDFFSQPQQVPGPSEKKEVGGGTGFIITSEGLIMTNKHVVDDDEAEYSVILNDGTKFDAQVIGKDPFNDVAFLKIASNNLPVVELGDSDKLQIGQTVMAIGFSLGEYSNSVTKGIISGIGREITAGGGGQTEKLENVIQTDAAINPGNSGGPLINLQGQVIGINTAINQQGQLIGFAIPINSAKLVIESVQKNGKIVRPYLGVRYIVLNSSISEQNNLAYDYGALIIRGENVGELAVMPGSPADKAGLVENDIILEFNGVKLDEEHTLSKEIAKQQPGEMINLKIFHDGEETTVRVVLEEFKE